MTSYTTEAPAGSKGKPIYDVSETRVGRTIIEASGALAVLQALEKRCKENGPGSGLAIAVAEGVVANYRVDIAANVLREAARRGHDVSKVKNVFSGINADGRAYIEIEEYGLADMAEDFA